MQGVRRAIRFLRIPFSRDFHFETNNPFVGRSQFVYGVRVRGVSEFSVFGSTSPGGCNGLHHGSMSQVKSLCTLQVEVPKQTVEVPTQPKKDPQQLYNDIVASLEKKILPYPSALQELIRSSSTSSEVALAMRAAELVRVFRTVQNGETVNHTREVTNMMVAAYLRFGDSNNALKLLQKQNHLGFTCNIGSVNLLLKHSKFHKNVSLMRKVLRVMETNDIQATQATADILLRQCKQAGETELMFSLAKGYIKQGLTLHQSLLDVLISSAANAGDVKLVYEVQNWRDNQGLVHSTASAVSVAKALLLESKPKEAALMIKDHCPDGDKRERYVTILVKVWPLQLVSAGNAESKEEYLRKLKENVVSMFDSLKELGLEFSVDVDKEFAQGKGSDSKAQKEVKSRSNEQTWDTEDETSL